MKKNNISIGQQKIFEHGPVYVIAEGGVNHNGNLDLAIQLVEMAHKIGADAVKFQTYKPEQVAIDDAGMVDYQVKNIGKKMSQREMIKAFELPENFYPPIIKRCQELGITFFSTPHGGRESARFLMEMGVPAFKVGSGDLTNYPLLYQLAQFHLPIILSTGMAFMNEVVAAVKYLEKKEAKQLVVLHCTTNYPCPENEVNMNAMRTMMQELMYPVGYSDHTESSLAAQTSTLMGQAMYEFHITLDRSLPGPDQKASADLRQAKERMKYIRRFEKLNKVERSRLLKQAKYTHILGWSEKKPNPSEMKFLEVRRSLVFTKNLPAGHKITDSDVEAKRPAGGISPTEWESFLGKKLKMAVKLDQQLSPNMFR